MPSSPSCRTLAAALLAAALAFGVSSCGDDGAHPGGGGSGSGSGSGSHAE